MSEPVSPTIADIAPFLSERGQLEVDLAVHRANVQHLLQENAELRAERDAELEGDSGDAAELA